jgi:hypothetical protein
MPDVAGVQARVTSRLPSVRSHRTRPFIRGARAQLDIGWTGHPPGLTSTQAAICHERRAQAAPAFDIARDIARRETPQGRRAKRTVERFP